MRDRYLFSADRDVSEYRDVLEVTPGHARLLTPSGAALTLRWIQSIALLVLYTAVMGAAVVGLSLAFGGGGAFGWPVQVLVFVLWFAGLLAVGWAADRRSLPLLASRPAKELDLVLQGARSFGTFQEVRARTVLGSQVKLVVDTGPRRFWEAVRLLEGNAAAPR